ncbi:MAG: hypothetical protein L6R42_003189, partial [Xanthoria sp. 1 TBL-2021]
MTTITTTGTNGIVSTVTSSTTVPAPPPPPPASSTSAITYVTTNPAGSTITTSRNTVITAPVSSNGPPPPPTSVVVVSSTNSQGSVIVSSSTSTAAVPYYSQACGGKYSDNFGQLWCVQCQTAYYYDDLNTITVGSFEECLEACDTYVPSPDVARGASCIAITWGPRTVGGECYRKFNVTDSRLDPREDSAYKCDQAVTPPSATSIINTDTANIASTRASTPASSGPNVPSTGVSVPVSSNPNLPTTRPTTPATSNAISPATSNPNVPATPPPASNTGVPATLISSTTTASSFNIDLAFQPCPSSNGQQFVDQLGYVYDINCGCDYQYSDLSGGTHQDYFQDCMLACDRYVPNPDSAGGAPCVAVSWGRPDRNPGANCYLKYRVEQVRCGEEEFCAAVKHTYQIPPGIISTSRVTSTASVVSVPASSSRASSSTSQPAVVTPSFTQNTAPSNTFAPPRISQTVSCPFQNGSIYTDFFGQTWQVRCGMNILGTNAKAVHADSWEKCLQFCDILGNVTGVTYPGGGGDESNPLSVNCYPYSVFTEFSYGAIPTL